jgi:tetratricopeptide (TPR) repeat protein
VSREKGSLEAAIADFTKAIELDPGLAIAYASRGLVRLLQGNTEEGEKDFASSLRLDPDSVRSSKEKKKDEASFTVTVVHRYQRSSRSHNSAIRTYRTQS